MLRPVEAVDHIEHRGLAGAVRPDNGADLALADVERHVGDRLHAAERERHVLDCEDRLAGRDVGAGGGGSHRQIPSAVIPGRTQRARPEVAGPMTGSGASPESITTNRAISLGLWLSIPGSRALPAPRNDRESL